jgi:hypothetical protein
VERFRPVLSEVSSELKTQVDVETIDHENSQEINLELDTTGGCTESDARYPKRGRG